MTGNHLAASICAAIGTIWFTGLFIYSTRVSSSAFVVLMILTVVVSLYLLGTGSCVEKFANRHDQNNALKTPRIIAYLLLGGYVVLLGLTLLTAAVKDTPSEEKWIEVFKSGFLLLGGGLTSVIGYYFGARETQEAAKTAREVDQQIRSGDKLAPTKDEDTLDEPDEGNAG